MSENKVESNKRPDPVEAPTNTVSVDFAFLESVVKFIDAVATRGAVRGEELIFFGSIRQYAVERLPQQS